jgi:hypothetical protein
MNAWKEPSGPLDLPPGPSLDPGKMPMLSPANAWRILESRTGVNVGRSTFYRWVSSGRVFSFRVGGRIYIPWPELEHVIRQCQNGIRL